MCNVRVSLPVGDRFKEQGAGTGLRWKMMRQLEDLDYADDIALISSTWTQAQTKLERQDPIKINSTEVEDTDSFVYFLGAIVNNLGGPEKDIRNRLGKDFQRCGERLNSAEKLRSESSSQTLLLSCCMDARHGEWQKRMKKGSTPFFTNARRILKVHWPMRVSNDEIRRRAKMEKISLQVRRRRWIGHVLRMAPTRNTQVELTREPSRKRKRGRPGET